MSQSQKNHGTWTDIWTMLSVLFVNGMILEFQTGFNVVKCASISRRKGDGNYMVLGPLHVATIQ